MKSLTFCRSHFASSCCKDLFVSWNVAEQLLCPQLHVPAVPLTDVAPSFPLHFYSSAGLSVKNSQTGRNEGSIVSSMGLDLNLCLFLVPEFMLRLRGLQTTADGRVLHPSPMFVDINAGPSLFLTKYGCLIYSRRKA